MLYNIALLSFSWLRWKEVLLELKRISQPPSVSEMAKAQFQLGCLYEIGDNVIEQNIQQACYWFHEAANHGHLEAKAKIAFYKHIELMDKEVVDGN